ncbi:MAG: spore germination protein GerW family protein [Methanobacteriaceae archaeon]|nr:spore germination protein GerW family protein [Methanobacteriaceae archaeon]
MELETSIKTAITEIRELINADSVIGSKIETKNKVIIPVTKTAIGFGVGAGKNKKDVTDNEVGGVGGGGSIEPIALIVISKNIEGSEGVSVLSLNGSVSVSEIIGDLTQTVDKVVSGIKGSKNSSTPEVEPDIEEIKTKIKEE